MHRSLRQTDALALHGGIVAGNNRGIAIQCVQIVVFIPHRFVGKEYQLCAFLRVTDVIEEVDLARQKFFHALEKSIAWDKFQVPSGICTKQLNIVIRIAGHGIPRLIQHHHSVNSCGGNADNLPRTDTLGARNLPRKKEKDHDKKHHGPM